MKSYECEGQLSLFDGLLDNEGYKKPAIGTNIVFMLDGNEYPCIVDSHCGYDMFWVRFTDRKPHDDDENIDNTDGWHLSLRGYGNSWKYESDQKPKEKTIQQPCGRPCDVEWCSKECFLKRGRVWNTKDGGWARDSQGETLKCKDRECNYEPDEFEDCFSDQEEAEAKTEKKEPQPLDIRGLCDDGYCPNCGHPFDEYMWPDEIDCEVCPECGTPLDWKVWHLRNDPKLKDKYPDLDTRYINPDTKEIENHPFEWKYTDTNPPKIEDIYFGCIVSKDNDGEDMYTYTTIRFMDGVYWIFNHPHKEWETLEKGNKGNTVIAWREYTSSELKTIRDYDSMVIYEIEEEEEEEKPATKKKESKRASKKATKKKPDSEEKEEEEDGERDQEDM